MRFISERNQMLPKGQYNIGEMPRFGLTQFASRFPSQTKHSRISISGNVENEITFSKEISTLPRSQITADFHCVTTWSSLAQKWEGYLFRDFFHNLIKPIVKPADEARFIVLRSQDGARTSFPLTDLLADNIILADSLNGQALSIEHGAPLRLVASDHYGYKSIKYLNRIEFRDNANGYRPSGFWFMEHPRARVAHEERGRFFPGWMLRYLYRPLVKPTRNRFRQAMKNHHIV